LAQSNCAIFYLNAALVTAFRKKAFQASSNQIKENGAYSGVAGILELYPEMIP